MQYVILSQVFISNFVLFMLLPANTIFKAFILKNTVPFAAQIQVLLSMEFRERVKTVGQTDSLPLMQLSNITHNPPGCICAGQSSYRAQKQPIRPHLM